jgi:predicted enzyme related to lactoylglutathione lyase
MNEINFFAIHADDVDRAQRFYRGVFGWTFESWGPPGFFLINGAGMKGALHGRMSPAQSGDPIAFECTVSVDDVNDIAAKVAEFGGTVTMQPATIPTVGTLIQFHDSEGNIVNAMKYDQPQS